jgi:DsbC/DsbD-like thiol-disulfide interchange protein
MNLIKVKNSLIVLFFFALAVQAGSRKSQSIQVQLISEIRTIQPNEKFNVGVYFQLPPHSHIYWRNPGNSGLPTRIKWDLPPGFTAGPLQWPYPRRLEAPEDVTYGYENEVLLITEITCPENLKPGETVPIAASVEWLLCAGSCIPGHADLILNMKVEKSIPKGQDAWIELFTAAKTRLPREMADWKIKASVHKGYIRLKLFPRFKAPAELTQFMVFPEQGGLIDDNAKQKIIKIGSGYLIELQLSKYLQELPSVFKGVLVSQQSWYPDQDVHAVYVDVFLEIHQGGSK